MDGFFAIDATENRNGGYLWGKYYIDGNVVDGGVDDKNNQKATANNWEYGVYNQFSNNYKKVVTQKLKTRFDWTNLTNLHR